MSFAKRTKQAPLHTAQLADRADAPARRVPAHRSQRTRSARRFLALLSLLLAILACSIGPRIGYHPPPATHRPAAELRLAIQIRGQYSDIAAPNVLVLVDAFEGANPKAVSFPERARLTCNGTDITPNPPGSIPIPEDWRPCPRQPPAGSYRLTYTDEHGASTAVVVPVPDGSFALLAPRDGATVPIPTDGPLTVRYSIPIPPPDGSVAVESVGASCSLGLTRPCGAVSARLQGGATPTPSGSAGPATATPNQDREPATPAAGATLAPGATPTPGGGAGPSAAIATATATQSGDMGTISLSGDFTMFQPAPGLVELSVGARVTPDRGGFAAATATFSDNLSTHITWAR